MLTTSFSETTDRFMEHLTMMHLTTIPCQVLISPVHDTVAGVLGNGDVQNTGFAAYCAGRDCMIVAGDIRLNDMTTEECEDVVLQSIAHEYMHHLQHHGNREYSEVEAHVWADRCVAGFRGVKWTQYDIDLCTDFWTRELESAPSRAQEAE